MCSKLTLAAGIVAVFAIGAVLPVWAHHAHSNYATELTDFEGVITEMHVLNPHAWIYVGRANAAGEEQVVALEAGGAAGIKKLEAQGELLKVGDKIKVRCHILLDGSPGCLLGFIKHPNGKIYDYDALNTSIEPITTLKNF
jgi:hypothetical protein